MVANIVDMSPSGHSEILNAEYPIDNTTYILLGMINVLYKYISIIM